MDPAVPTEDKFADSSVDRIVAGRDESEDSDHEGEHDGADHTVPDEEAAHGKTLNNGILRWLERFGVREDTVVSFESESAGEQPVEKDGNSGFFHQTQVSHPYAGAQ